MSALTTLAALVTGVAQPMSFGGPRAGGGPPFPLFAIPLFWLLLLGGITAAVLLGRRRRERLAGAAAGERALAERFAAGEIDETDYRNRRAVLREKE